MDPVQVAAVAARELARERVRVPVKERARIRARGLARGATTNAQLLALNPVRVVVAVQVAGILAVLDAQTVVREIVKAVALLDVELLVEVVPVLVRQTVRVIAVEHVATSVLDKQQHQYIHFRRKYENDSY